MIKSILSAVFIFSLLCQVSSQHPVFTNQSSFRDSRVREYITPKSILWLSDTTGRFIVNPERLLLPGNGQADLSSVNLCYLYNDEGHQAALVLDFGYQMFGALQIISGIAEGDYPVSVRVRFGESVSETFSDTGEGHTATNDHAMRDMTLQIPMIGSIEVGKTGFRFVRIDLLGETNSLCLKEINAISVYRDIPYLGSFNSSDSLLNEIWLTGAYSVHLNMQEYLWDGIKRDQLVWVGDMHPEVMTIHAVFGYNEVVPQSLDLVRNITPVDEWMNGISSYSMWWVLVHDAWYHQHADIGYLQEQAGYLRELLEKFCSMIDEDGNEHLDGHRFLDWPSSPYTEAVDAGYHALLKLTLEAGVRLSMLLNDPQTAQLCESKAALLASREPDLTESKQAAALLGLAGLITPEQANEIISHEGAKRFSTFYGYYMLQAMALAENYTGALDIIRDYWGGMLHLGATTFWEDFNIEWMENAARIDELPPEGKIDVHATYGDYCYVGFRHSFCHGWASGPTTWMSEHVLGIRVIEPGCSIIAIEPNLGDLEWAEGTYPTPLGIIHVRHERLASGEIKTEYTAPEGVTVVKM